MSLAAGPLTGAAPEPIVPHGATSADVRLTRRRLASHLAGLAVTVLALGVLAAIAWKLTAPTPSVTVSGDGTAAVTNRTMAEYFGADADFMIIGMFAGLGLGALCWRWLKTMGWPIAFVSVAAGMLGALVAWRVGIFLGPHDFDQRVAYASSGQQVAIDLALRTPTAWLSWPLGAVLTVLLYSAFGADDQPLFRRSRELPVPETASAPSQPPRSSHRSIRFPSARSIETISRPGRRNSPGSAPKGHRARSRD
ncbi:MAG: hypothetical protein WAX29_11755 [Propionibacterium sp.]